MIGSTLQYVTLNDQQKMPVRVIGRGKPVIMLHGFGMSADIWIPFILPYIKEFKFYLPHLRGFGLASDSRPGDDDLYRAYRNDIAAMRQQFGLDKVILIGYSMGAGLALSLFRHGMAEGVERYLQMDFGPGFLPSSEWPEMIFVKEHQRFINDADSLATQTAGVRNLPFRQIPFDLRKQAIGQMQKFLQMCTVQPWQKRVLGQMERYPTLIQRLPIMKSWDMLLLMLSTIKQEDADFTKTLPEIRIPVTFFYGAKSEIYSEATQLRMFKLLPQARVVRFNESGHLLLLDEPKKFIRELGRFLKGR